MASLEDECCLLPDGDDLFTALGHKLSQDDNEDSAGLPRTAARAISRRQHRLQRAWGQIDLPAPLAIPLQDGLSPGRRRWRWAFQKIHSLEDPWKRFNLNRLTEERAIRHRYSALKKEWVKDQVRVKLDPEVFTCGAMRDCHRLKKLSNWVHCADWTHASNYVAKRYKQSVNRDVYFEDVRLQMEAKLWGEEFNRSNPPKKVDFVQMSVLELVERPGQPLYHLEHFIEGDYRKYNSNSGFVDETLRSTPQALSHFTFERSGHQLMVIDVQGVGDLYTDPQIHTADGANYSDGNLGTRGMALFFHSHRCNAICASLGLSRFDLTPKEEERQETERSVCAATRTVVREGVLPIGSPELCRQFAPTSPSFPSTDSGVGNEEDEEEEEDEEVEEDGVTDDFLTGLREVRRQPRRRYESSCSELDHEEERLAFHMTQRMLHQPSCLVTAGPMLRTLGAVHHELAQLHRDERFGAGVDWDAILFHERHAAEMGCVEAMVNMGQHLQGLASDLLQECPLKADGSGAEGLLLMTRAAELGDRSAMIFVANAQQHGSEVAECEPNWALAAEWYRRAVATSGFLDDEGCYDSTIDHPIHSLLHNLAQLHAAGGHGLKRDLMHAADLFEEAAEAATAAMKGRFACRMYELAEEARAEAE